jgi:hypothetical protein
MALGQIDFNMPPSLLAALALAASQPAWLLAAARLPGMSGRNTLQFVLSGAGVVIVWSIAAALAPALRPSDLAELFVCLMIFGGATLAYLQIWALLTTGYTIAILLALLKSNRPLSEDEISSAYRSGEGVQWVMHRRVGGLIKAGLVKRNGDSLALSSSTGLAVAYVYRASVAILGLKRTG